MAFDASPSSSCVLPIDSYSTAQALVLATETAKSLGWNIGYMDETRFIANTISAERSSSEEFSVEIQGYELLLESKSFGNQINSFDFGINNTNIEKFTSKFEELKTSLDAAEMNRLYEELKPRFTRREETPPVDPVEMAELAKIKRGKNIAESIFPTNDYFVTPILIDINLLVFILMVVCGVSIFFPEAQTMIQWGANYGPRTMNGEGWRFLTSFFVHAGLLHVLFNMGALMYVGALLEPRIGRGRFLMVYLLSGIISSVMSTFWHPEVVSAGASGAIFGLYGTFLALLWTKCFNRAIETSMTVSTVIFVAYNLMNGATAKGIDNAAHVGGLVCGLVLGYLYSGSLKKEKEVG